MNDCFPIPDLLRLVHDFKPDDSIQMAQSSRGGKKERMRIKNGQFLIVARTPLKHGTSVKRRDLLSKMVIACKVAVLQELLNWLALVHLVGRKGITCPKECEHCAGSEFGVVGGPNHGWRVSCLLIGVVNICCACRFELSKVQSSGFEGPSWCS